MGRSTSHQKTEREFKLLKYKWEFLKRNEGYIKYYACLEKQVGKFYPILAEGMLSPKKEKYLPRMLKTCREKWGVWKQGQA